MPTSGPQKSPETATKVEKGLLKYMKFNNKFNFQLPYICGIVQMRLSKVAQIKTEL